MAKTFSALKKRLRELDGYSIKAGILENATYPDSGMSVAKVARMQEYGTSTIPPRPFLRNTMDEKGRDWIRQLAKGVALHLRDDLALEHVTTLVGGQMASDIKATIKAGVQPPISEVTKMMRYMTKTENKPRSGATYRDAVRKVKAGEHPGPVDDTPLYDTHMLYNAIDYE